MTKKQEMTFKCYSMFRGKCRKGEFKTTEWSCDAWNDAWNEDNDPHGVTVLKFSASCPKCGKICYSVVSLGDWCEAGARTYTQLDDRIKALEKQIASLTKRIVKLEAKQ